MVTKVTIELDAVALATVQQGLAALQLNAQAISALIQAQVGQQLAAEAAAKPADDKPA